MNRNATELLLKQALLGKILTLELQVLDLAGHPRNLVITTFPLFN